MGVTLAFSRYRNSKIQIWYKSIDYLVANTTYIQERSFPFVDGDSGPDWHLDKSQSGEYPTGASQRSWIDVAIGDKSAEVGQRVNKDAHQRERNEKTPSEFPVDAQADAQHEFRVAQEILQSCQFKNPFIFLFFFFFLNL